MIDSTKSNNNFCSFPKNSVHKITNIECLAITLLIVGILAGIGAGVHYDISGNVGIPYTAIASTAIVLSIVLAYASRKQNASENGLSKVHVGRSLQQEIFVGKPGILATESLSDVQEHVFTLNEKDIPLFNNWLFFYDGLHPKQREILEATVAKQPPKAGTVLSYIMIKEKGDATSTMETHLSQRISGFDCLLDSHWARYDKQGHYYVDFANKKHFGGGHITQGCVQEEQMFWAKPQLPHLAFAADIAKKPIQICGEGEIEQANSFIIPNISGGYDLRKVPYGLSLYSYDKPLAPLVQETPEAPPVHIIGLAAMDWRGKKRSHAYTKDELLYHYKAAFLAFQRANELEKRQGNAKAIIHTGAWGCGAFLNSEKTMIHLQLLAAAAAGVQIVFHGVDTDSLQKHYTTAFVQERIESVIKSGRTIGEEIDWILAQQTDPTWRTK